MYYCIAFGVVVIYSIPWVLLGACVQVLAEFCAQDEDGQTPLLFAARSGSGAVFRQALEALLARATPEKVGQTT